MSFILDALKKSESDRQRRDEPGFADVPRAQASRTGPKWLWIVVILLVGNLVAIAGMYLWPDSEPAVVGASADRLVPAAPAQTQQRQPAAGVIVEREPQPAGTPVRQAPPETGAQTTVARPAPATTPAAQPPVAAPPPRATVSTGLPTFNEVRATGRVTLPDLHLDIHVYSEQPSGRFVFVNMNKYLEDSTLKEGPLVREITPEGVVLEHMGTGFLLPRE